MNPQPAEIGRFCGSKSPHAPFSVTDSDAGMVWRRDSGPDRGPSCKPARSANDNVPRGRGRGNAMERLAWRLTGEVLPYWRSVLVIFVVNLLAIPLALLTPVPLKIAVDNVLGDKPLPRYLDVLLPDAVAGTNLRLLLAAAVLQVLVVVLAQLQQMSSYVLRVRSGEILTQAVREKLFGHAQRLSLLRHDARGSSDSVYRIQYDAAELQKVTIDGVLTTTTAAITLGVTIVVVCRLDWQLAAVGLV